MVDLLVIIVDEASNYAKHYEEFLTKFFALNHTTMTVLLIFSNQGKYQRIFCGAVESAEDFPDFTPFEHGSDDAEIQNWIEEAIVYRQLSQLSTDTIKYFYAKHQKAKSLSTSVEITAKEDSEYRELIAKKPTKPSKLISRIFCQHDNYQGELGYFSDFAYGTRDYGTHKLEGFWRHMDTPIGFMRRITDEETSIDYFDEDGKFVKRFSKNKAKRPLFLIRKLKKFDFHAYITDDGTIYCEAEFKNGAKKHGKMNIFNFKMDGFGSWYFANGNKYHGQFKNDKLHGIGTYYFKNGSIYHGHFKDGTFHGKGQMVYCNGDIFEGDFVEGVCSGKGTLQYSNGDIYVGDFKEGKPNGYGSRFSKDCIEVGPWGDNITGKQINYYENGVILISYWKDYQLNDKVRKLIPNGNIQEFEIVDGVITEKGTYTWTDGSVYEGEFLDNKFHGLGIKTYPDGRIEEGIWESGSLVTPKLSYNEVVDDYNDLGKNDKCSCGSGKKYKNCHGRQNID